jgi:hypothetical protein
MFRFSKTKKDHGGNLWQVDGGYSLDAFWFAQELELLQESLC